MNKINTEFIDFNIVLVEDDYSFGLAIKELLEFKNFNVKWFRESAVALTWIKAVKNIDIIITDVLIPNIDGQSFIVEVQKLHFKQTIPIIYITALNENSLELKGINSKRILHKPFPIQKLIDFIEPYLKQKKKISLEEQKKLFEKTIKKNLLSNNLFKIICEMISIDIHHLDRWVLDNYGMNFSEFILKMKIKKAIELIKTGKNNISQIALESGFNNTKIFETKFEEITGTLPDKFIENLQQN